MTTNRRSKRMVGGIIYLGAFAGLLFSANSMQTSKTIGYLPLGDSYTIGTGALEKEAWPSVLTEHLTKENLPVKLLAKPARNGFTTEDLIAEELPALKKLRPDLVTLLIGVNDWVRGVSKIAFAKNLAYILDEVERTLPDRKKIVLITIPDFGVTPVGKNYSRGRNISEGISEFNKIIKAEAKKRSLALVDIFEISKEMGNDKSLVAGDGLHPSAKEYAIWEGLISTEVKRILRK